MVRLAALIAGVVAVACLPARGDATDSPRDERIPVIAWGGPPPAQASVERYRELADCGFTHSFTGFVNLTHMIKALDAAKEAGVKLLASCPELESDPQATTRRLRAHPALGGYFLRDEPSAADFGSLAKWVQRVQSVDPDHLAYINLFPDYANSQQLGVGTYGQYVDRFVNEVPVPVISFDYYPIVDHSVRASWYANLETISSAARAAHKPFWAFVLSLPHYNYPTPTVAHLREQAYSNLAYGAQGIQYFTYWAAGDLGSGSPIDAHGKRTPVYDRVKQVNKEIRSLSRVFVGSRLLWVGHTGDSIPEGTRRPEPGPPIRSLTTEGTGVVVSLLANRTRRFLVMVNRDIEKPTAAAMSFDKRTVASEVGKDGSEKQLPARVYHAQVGPGDVVVLTWSQG